MILTMKAIFQATATKLFGGADFGLGGMHAFRTGKCQFIDRGNFLK
jgi:hypothetical protein